jgi:hypothetical protein
MSCQRCGADSCGRSYGANCNDGRFAPGAWIAFVKEATAKWSEPKVQDPFGRSIDGCMPSAPPRHQSSNVVPFRRRT